jgi:hypothetical protein
MWKEVGESDPVFGAGYLEDAGLVDAAVELAPS